MVAARGREDGGSVPGKGVAEQGSLPGGAQQRQAHPAECAYVCPTQGQIHKHQLGCAVAEGISLC